MVLPSFQRSVRLLIPVNQAPRWNVTVHVEAGRVCEVRDAEGDCENIALLPGWINAHTHLEFSSLGAPLSAASGPFAHWVASVIQLRRDQGESLTAWQQRGIRLGLEECEQQGVYGIGEIATQDWTQTGELQAAAQHADMILFREYLGLSDAAVQQHLAAAAELLATPVPGKLTRALSPHAPYSTAVSLVEGLAQLAASHQVPLAIHLAESQDELQLLASHEGPLVQLLQQMGVWNPSEVPAGQTPLDYLRRLRECPRVLVVHGNYLAAGEIRWLAERQEQFAVVYCPRTHAWFGHPKYPLQAMLEEGVRVLLGTDSRASNPDLSVFREWQTACRRHPNVSPALLLGSASWQSASFLEFPPVGVEVGHPYRAAAVRLPRRDATDPYSLLLDTRCLPTSAWPKPRS